MERAVNLSRLVILVVEASRKTTHLLGRRWPETSKKGNKFKTDVSGDENEIDEKQYSIIQANVEYGCIKSRESVVAYVITSELCLET